MSLGVVTCWRRLAGAERGSRGSQILLNRPRERICATEHAPRGRCHVLKRRYGLADIVERGAFVIVERRRVIKPRPERELMTLPENASLRGHNFAKHHLGFLEAP